MDGTFRSNDTTVISLVTGPPSPLSTQNGTVGLCDCILYSPPYLPTFNNANLGKATPTNTPTT